LKHRTIRLEDLAEAFLSSNVVHKSGLLPNNIIKYLKSGSNEMFVMFFPAESRTMKFNDGTSVIKTYEDVKLPSRIWIAAFKGENFSLSKSFFVKESHRIEIKEDTVLYKNIFPNVYGDCKICWGYNGVKAFSKPSLADAIDYSFFNSEFNSDLINTDYYRRQNAGGVAEFFTFLKTTDKYPENLFIEAGATVRSLIL
jgi:hypothetical protein